MESEKISEKQEEILSILEEKYPSLPPREDIISVLQESQVSAQGEWLSPALVQFPSRAGLLYGVARPEKVNLNVPSLSSLLFTLWEIFRQVMSHLEAESLDHKLLWGLQPEYVVNSHI